jgi:hypothetical protein
VLAPNSPLRAAVTALAQAAAAQPATVEAAQPPGAGVLGVKLPGNVASPTPEPAAPPKRVAHYLWAVLIARIYEVVLLLCPLCGGQMRIIAFITHSADVRQILHHIVSPRRSPRHAGHRCGRTATRRSMIGVQSEPDWDLAAQPAPDFEDDQRINW